MLHAVSHYLYLGLVCLAAVFGLGPGVFMIFCSLFDPAVRSARNVSTRTRHYFHRENRPIANHQEK